MPSRYISDVLTVSYNTEMILLKLLVISKLDGVLDESIRRELELFRNVLPKIFKGHHLKVNVFN